MWHRVLTFLCAGALALVGLAVTTPPAFAQPTSTSGGCNNYGQCSVGGSWSEPGSTTSSTSAPGNPGGGGGGASTPNPCALQYASASGQQYVASPCATGRYQGNYLPTGGCAISSTPVVLFGVQVGVYEQLGTWTKAAMPPGSLQKYAGEVCSPLGSPTFVPANPSVPPQLTIAQPILLNLAAEVHLATPTPWLMPSPQHPGPPPCSACVTAQDRSEGYANHPEWLAVEQGPGVTSGLSATIKQCDAGVCATVGVTLTPKTVDFEWIGADSYAPFHGQVHTVSCPAGAIIPGAPAPLGYAPASDDVARAFDTWHHGLWFQWYNKRAIFGGPGCAGSIWDGGNGTPRRSVDFLPDVGGGHPPVEFYTPRQVTKQDCIDVGNTAARPWPAWCYQMPIVDTIHAYLTYAITWTFGGVLAGAQPPGLPTTYNVLTSDPANVATTTLPVVAEHTDVTCISGTGSKQQCNANTPFGTGDMGPAPING